MLLNLITAHRDDRFQLAINESMDPKQAHGAASVVEPTGQRRNVPFQVNHPRRIQHPTPDQLKDLFNQFEQLGYHAETVFIGKGHAKRSFKRSAAFA